MQSEDQCLALRFVRTWAENRCHARGATELRKEEMLIARWRTTGMHRDGRMEESTHLTPARPPLGGGWWSWTASFNRGGKRAEG